MEPLEHGHSAAEIAARLDRQDDNARLRDAVFGGIDGTVTTFAIVAGVQGAGLPAYIVVALGMANVLADGFSMAAGNYSGTKAALDDRRRLWRVEERHIAINPAGEREELRQILERKGLDGEVLIEATRMISDSQSRWIEAMLTDEYGLAPADPRPLAAAISIFAAFILAGVIPLLPYLLGLPNPFTAATIAALMTFFAIGALKSRWSLSAWWRSGLETLIVGALAAGIAYSVGWLFHPG